MNAFHFLNGLPVVIGVLNQIRNVVRWNSGIKRVPGKTYASAVHVNNIQANGWRRNCQQSQKYICGPIYKYICTYIFKKNLLFDTSNTPIIIVRYFINPNNFGHLVWIEKNKRRKTTDWRDFYHRQPTLKIVY